MNESEAVLAGPENHRVEAGILESTLSELLAEDFDFKGQPLSGSTHRIHAFPAKFPPQLPAKFISRLTSPGDVVLDPMMGSGTTLVEASSQGRTAVGFDLDPLAVKQCRVKTTPIRDLDLLWRLSESIAAAARDILGKPGLDDYISDLFDGPTREFVDYWFSSQSQREIAALQQSTKMVIGQLEELAARATAREFFEVALSAIIVTKSGGITKARDLAHGRAHLALDKSPKDGIRQFELRCRQNIQALGELSETELGPVFASVSDARDLRGVVEDESVNLVVTSPPYANAIDYMRAHKFSLVWFGWPIRQLSQRRSEYIGTERTKDWRARPSYPRAVQQVVDSVHEVEPRRSRVLARYFDDMTSVLSEINRVLMPSAYAVLVVGPSTIRGLSIDTAELLTVIASSLSPPLSLAGMARRTIDRDRRLLPASKRARSSLGIEQRIHHESIICLQKALVPT